MSSQAVRNKINTSINRVILEVRRKAIEEGKKKIAELKDQLLSPEQIIKTLQSDINHGSCSIKGKNQFEEKAQQLLDQLDKIDEITQKGLTVLTGLEEKIGSISTRVEIPNIPSPIEGIQAITDAIKAIMEPLRYVIMAAPSILVSQISFPGSGGPVNGLVIANTNNGVNLAKVKIAEYTQLFRSLPTLLDRYISKANIIFDNITKLKSKIQIIVDEIEKLKYFIIYMKLKFEDDCNKFTSLSVPSLPNTGGATNTDPPTTSPITLEDIIAQTQELYTSLLEDLIARGDNRAIRRVYKLGVQFQRIKNIKVEQRYIGGGVGGGLDESMYQNYGGTTNWDLINNS